ncbi:nucleotide exchange factor GrpE [Desulfurivibrio alkaliphilus]|uniref:Protein GrpE n=1 Tax=Desulfurivibrio alkaliphilus (strain DSM 19089 / UNIQEM U267 / AHT2) TaxID=589865 RepID=D6Z5B4_DESAT|nr:nucleotide exchange factor GrpE [Desulfurivibrio alkaliphilus]ADH84771.1 GrpE protein [Desulfurivibrio alkaliphilus AHT 2]
MEEKEKMAKPGAGPDGAEELGAAAGPAGAGESAEGELQSAEQEQGEETDDLLVQLSEARSEAHDLEDRMLRLAAEFENYKKRMQRERESAFKYAEEDLLKELLPALDNLERAIEQGHKTNDASALLEGVEMTYRGLLAGLEKFGLKPLESRGQAFDPNYHEAMAMEASDEFPANTVISEFQRGYLYKDRLIRAAKVVVSNGPGSSA